MKSKLSSNSTVFLAVLGLALVVMSSSAFAGNRRAVKPPAPTASTAAPAISTP
jgi:hypothetical protein